MDDVAALPAHGTGAEAFDGFVATDGPTTAVIAPVATTRRFHVDGHRRFVRGGAVAHGHGGSVATGRCIGVLSAHVVRGRGRRPLTEHRARCRDRTLLGPQLLSGLVDVPVGAIQWRQAWEAARDRLRRRLARILQRGSVAITGREAERVVQIDAAEIVGDLLQVPTRHPVDATRPLDRDGAVVGDRHQGEQVGHDRQILLHRLTVLTVVPQRLRGFVCAHRGLQGRRGIRDRRGGGGSVTERPLRRERAAVRIAGAAGVEDHPQRRGAAMRGGGDVSAQSTVVRRRRIATKIRRDQRGNGRARAGISGRPFRVRLPTGGRIAKDGHLGVAVGDQDVGTTVAVEVGERGGDPFRLLRRVPISAPHERDAATAGAGEGCERSVVRADQQILPTVAVQVARGEPRLCTDVALIPGGLARPPGAAARVLETEDRAVTRAHQQVGVAVTA